jgi:hypothetical protein
MLVMVLLSIAGDDTAESTLVVAIDEGTIRPKSNKRMTLL